MDLRTWAVLGTTTTAAFRRQLRLPAPTARALAEHRRRQDAQRSAVGERWQEHGLVFPSTRGALLDPADLRRGLRNVTEAAGDLNL